MLIMRMQNYIKTAIVLILSKLGTLFKLSWVIGSASLMFSASSFCMPLIGLFSGTLGTTLIWTLLFVVRVSVAPLSLSSLAFYIPGYCASLYLASENKYIRSGIALLCMILFLIHPVGFAAAPYTVYWIIPVMVAFGFFKSLFAHALGATFTAHAVGSVIWLYTVPMAASNWLSLIPVVAIERLTFAAGIVVLYHLIDVVCIHAVNVKKNAASVFSLIR